MTDTLEEVHRASMMNERASALYGVLCQPGEKLCVIVWDSWPVQIQKPENHRNQRGSWSTKHHGNSLSRLEGCDLEGKPVFTLTLSASTSPRATDEAMAYFILDVEGQAVLTGGFTDKLCGLPGYTMVHLLDNGFRLVTLIASDVVNC